MPGDREQDVPHQSLHCDWKLLQIVPALLLFPSKLKLHENLPSFPSIELLHSKISPRRFYRIVLFNEGLEKLIFPSVASLVAVQLIKLHGIFNLALWASILT